MYLQISGSNQYLQDKNLIYFETVKNQTTVKIC